jgi:hypothetical protein
MERIMKLKASLFNRVVMAGLLGSAASAAFAGPVPIGGVDNSQSRFGGDGYAYFQEDTPGSSKSIPPYRVTNPSGVTLEYLASKSSGDPVWQPAADPVPHPAGKAAKVAFFNDQDRFLRVNSTP